MNVFLLSVAERTQKPSVQKKVVDSVSVDMLISWMLKIRKLNQGRWFFISRKTENMKDFDNRKLTALVVIHITMLLKITSTYVLTKPEKWPFIILIASSFFTETIQSEAIVWEQLNSASTIVVKEIWTICQLLWSASCFTCLCCQEMPTKRIR